MAKCLAAYDSSDLMDEHLGVFRVGGMRSQLAQLCSYTRVIGYVHIRIPRVRHCHRWRSHELQEQASVEMSIISSRQAV
jgi:hypothetical protein